MRRDRGVSGKNCLYPHHISLKSMLGSIIVKKMDDAHGKGSQMLSDVSTFNKSDLIDGAHELDLDT